MFPEHVLGVLFIVAAGLVFVLHIFLKPRFSPLHELPGPPSNGLFTSHLKYVLDAEQSPRVVEKLVQKYGRTFRINGYGAYDERLITLDPVAMNHILVKSWIYQKPWQSRRQLARLMGNGLLTAEGSEHRRQRKVANPAFSQKNLRTFAPMFFERANELCARWQLLLEKKESIEVDVCHWLGVLALDMIGSTSFDYSFNALQEENNEVFRALRSMLEIGFLGGYSWDIVMGIYFPPFNKIWRNKTNRTIDENLRILHEMGRELIDRKKDMLSKGGESPKKDLLSLLLISNLSSEIPLDQRLSDDEIFDQVLTFMLVGSDTTSLAIVWALELLSKHTSCQTRLREELHNCVIPSKHIDEEGCDDADYIDLFRRIDVLPYLDNVVRETLRLAPPVHSSIRVASRDDVIPLSEPIPTADGTMRTSIGISKGQFVHIPMDSYNLDRTVWGEDAWQFVPDRWTKLPDKVRRIPGVHSGLLSFSAGPRSCIGMTYAIMQMKVVLYTLLTKFEFGRLEEIKRVNMVFVRPFVAGRTKEGSRCPLSVRSLQA